MIIGGQAVLLYGFPRLTRDIDITLGIDTDKLPLIKNVCRKLSLNLLVNNPERFAAETKVLPAEEKKIRIRIDFIFSFTSYEKQAIRRARKVLMAGYPVKFASCEDVVVHKMIAGRAIDEEDVRNILIKNKKKIDPKYIRRWLAKFGEVPGQKDLLERFHRLLKLTS